jgi:hypothetical protein
VVQVEAQVVEVEDQLIVREAQEEVVVHTFIGYLKHRI